MFEALIWIGVGALLMYLVCKFWFCPGKDTSCCQEDPVDTKPKKDKKIKK